MSTPPPIARQASKSDADVELLPVEVGQTVWVPGAADRVWDKASVMAIGGLKVTVRTQAGKIQQVDRGLAVPLNPREADDMTSLYYIHEAGVLHNLEERCKLDGGDGTGQKPYTFMANVLIAVNPLRELPNPRISEVVNTAGSAPHPYSIAEMAYQQMVYNSGTDQPTNQSVVISGESGAGKTESSKIVLRHLTTRGLYGKKARGDDIENMSKTRQQHGTSLDHRLIEQNPILEAFGNAKTLRNYNSSRFGKFMKLQFTADGEFKLAGALVETYLLEKSRLVYQVDGERNFHIFYQLLAGASPQARKEFELTQAEDFCYLNQSGCYIAEETDDRACFEAVVRGLSCVGIDEQVQHVIFSVVAGLLHLGNIEFDEEDTPEGEAAVIEKDSAKRAVVTASRLLGVNEKDLRKVIMTRDIVTREETYTVRRNEQAAVYARDAIAKALYSRMFDWVIKQVNSSLGHDPNPLPYIGVLDIFGFESFQRNDFEQLLINYTNEVLQATFNNQVFIAEMELYKREGITVGRIKWPDNRECVDLIASKPNGILSLLDAEAMNPQPSDAKFLRTLHSKHSKHPYFPRPHPKDMEHMFIVRHFAGAVSYTIGSFIDKNNDSIPPDMSNLFSGSSNKLVPAFFKQEVDTSRPGKRKLTKSVAAKFSNQMQELVDTLDATRCNFIRCIKPNALMRVGMFDPRYVVGQLRCQGIMQTAQVLKVGLPTRVSYSELVGAYKKFMPPDAQRLFANQSDPTLITAILWAFQVPMDAYKLGITKLFFKAGKIAVLDSILKINWATEGPHIVSRMKLWLARRRWRVGLAKVIAQNRFAKLLRRIQFRRNSLVRIQRWWRALSVRREFQKKRTAVVVVQALFRGMTARRLFKSKKQEMLALAAARAAEAKRQAEEAKRREEEARMAAEIARRESIARAAAEEDRLRMEAEARAAEEEAIRLAKEAAAAVAEAEAAAAEATAAVEHERQAELRAIAEAKELEERMEREREEAERRKEQALLEAASVSASLLSGLAQVNSVQTPAGQVHVVEIPDDVSQENREQLQQLNDLLLSGAIAQAEYDELVPFLLEKPEEAPSGAALSAEQEESLSRLYTTGVYGIQIRCPACGATNNTANGNHCDECGSLLTTSDESAAAAADPAYYGYRGQSRQQRSLSTLTAPLGTFSTENGRIVIHDGYFEAQMHRTQVLQDDNYTEYTVYVLRCQWQPKDSNESTNWLVSHRFSVFEKLHKDLKRKIPTAVATIPLFPRKHVLGGVFKGKTGNSSAIVEERKQGLERYVAQVLELCARLPENLNVPELDRFLNVSRQVEQFRRQVLSNGVDESGAAPGGFGRALNVNAGGAEGMAAREQARLPTELPTPLDEEELSHTEQAVALLNASIRSARGDLRRDPGVQHHLKVCVQLLPRLQISANLDNPFANVDLIPRAMQCQEDLETTMGLYNDSLLAVTETYALSAQEGSGVTQPPPYVPGQQNSYQPSYGV
ncbi:myosin-like protein [Phytophthora cinnamomi]|uniref:myosin-like protein n=1 Tax=Phytophthora cinnamomi TaxID=4785 RepID=UPI003559B118|nr:myosin-like protein [Phytophthora cinnamomi]